MHVKFTETVTSWHVRVSFSSPITDFQVWVGGNIQCSSTSCEFDNMDWDGNINAGEILDIPYLYHFPTNAQSEINGIALRGVSGAIKTLQSVRNEREIEVRIQRGGEFINLNVSVQ